MMGSKLKKLEVIKEKMLESVAGTSGLSLEVLHKTTTGDEADLAFTGREEFLAMRLRQRSDLYAKKITTTLKKIEDGTFGFCEECGQDIGEHRLLARPSANFCIGCQEEKEFKEKSIIHNRRDLKKVSETQNKENFEIEFGQLLA